jgi:hypothetical protein
MALDCLRVGISGESPESANGWAIVGTQQNIEGRNNEK